MSELIQVSKSTKNNDSQVFKPKYKNKFCCNTPETSSLSSQLRMNGRKIFRQLSSNHQNTKIHTHALVAYDYHIHHTTNLWKILNV